MDHLDELETDTVAALRHIADMLRKSLSDLGYVESKHGINGVPSPSEWTKNDLPLEIDGEPATITSLIFRCDVAIARISVKTIVAPPVGVILLDALAQCPELFAGHNREFRKLQARIAAQIAQRVSEQ